MPRASELKRWLTKRYRKEITNLLNSILNLRLKWHLRRSNLRELIDELEDLIEHLEEEIRVVLIEADGETFSDESSTSDEEDDEPLQGGQAVAVE